MNNKDSVEVCVDFFKKAFPVSGSKNVRTQLGIVFEEFAELIKEVTTESVTDQLLLTYLHAGIASAGEHLKNTDGDIIIKDRVALLDGMADIMVTVIGLGYHTKMDIMGGFNEVNRSNNSKFGENGEPILDNNLKLIKGPLYSKPDLTKFV